jgi:ATP-dependent exoDNAse (exonuclease V) beta subunit
VVGDVKQAIYRWRSGDWRLLAGGLQDSFPVFGLKNQILSSNWRSHGLVIRFNNSVFSVAPVVLQQQYNEALTNQGWMKIRCHFRSKKFMPEESTNF